MAVKTIVQPPAKVLVEKSVEVDPSRDDKLLRGLLTDLRDTLLAQVDPKGVGLSAPQLGVAKRVFVARKSVDGLPLIMVNPVIVSKSKQMTSKADNRKSLEGCLSIPDMYGEVMRVERIGVEYWTADWDKVRSGKLELRKEREDYGGFVSRVFQHELDHLDGVLFTMRVLEQGGRLYQLEMEDGEEVLVEVGL